MEAIKCIIFYMGVSNYSIYAGTKTTFYSWCFIWHSSCSSFILYSNEICWLFPLWKMKMIWLKKRIKLLKELRKGMYLLWTFEELTEKKYDTTNNIPLLCFALYFIFRTIYIILSRQDSYSRKFYKNWYSYEKAKLRSNLVGRRHTSWHC